VHQRERDPSAFADGSFACVGDFGHSPLQDAFGVAGYASCHDLSIKVMKSVATVLQSRAFWCGCFLMAGDV
jgi:hypothetical protein